MPQNDPAEPTLADLEAAMKEAEQAARDYADRIAAERRQLFPHPDQLLERAVWPEEQNAELERLRAAHMQACRRVWAAREAEKAHANEV